MADNLGSRQEGYIKQEKMNILMYGHTYGHVNFLSPLTFPTEVSWQWYLPAVQNENATRCEKLLPPGAVIVENYLSAFPCF